ncbi:MAG: hypothetical protein FVQ85_16475 [Planctomycetes bacterium]|nr:hypothetical protein [Planctomycetota bacterium]
MMQNNVFLLFKMAPCLMHAGIRVSDDTKTCGTPLKPSPTGGLRLPAGKHTGILTDFQTKVNKKMAKKELFFGHPREACHCLKLKSST